MIRPARKFSCLSMPKSLILEQSNPGGRTLRSIPPIALFFCCAFANLEGEDEALEPRSASEAPTRNTDRPSKTRRLKNAERVEHFFCIMESGVEDGAHS